MPQQPNVQNEPRQAMSRRQLLKILAASGGAVAASTLLPDKWTSPVVETGLLPAHAQQVSPIYAITGCYAADAQTQEGLVYPWATLETYATLAPINTEILLRRTLVLLGSPDQTLDTFEGTADASGLFQPPSIDLAPFEFEGGEMLEVRWTFVNTDEGRNSCTNDVEVLEPPN